MTYTTFPDMYRALTVGFEDTVKQLNDITKTTAKAFGYPPYNIVKLDDNKYAIEIAVAGFGKQDLEIELKDNSLVVSGKVNVEPEETNYLYKGIANRAFTRTFNIADTVEVQNTQLLNGMLRIYLENIIPDNKKPKKFDIDDKGYQYYQK